ncbi:MAG: NAD(P)-dependent oxidoreductase [Novosphingobium sp.]|nr:NAD(P)-dependent oxidoreductase [Novosphingobium sp.]
MSETNTTLGFIGLGVMGSGMCGNVVKKHPAPVWAFDLDAGALAEQVKAGAKQAASVAEVAANAGILFLSLPGGKQVAAVCEEISANAKPGTVVVDLSTTSVAEARAVAARLAEKDMLFADAPVARTRQAAIDGTLSIMVGASEELFARTEPLLSYMGSDVTRCGEVGCGQVVKLINNTLNFVHVLILAEMMVTGERAGVEPATLLEAVSKGSGDSFILRNHGMKAMVPRSFPEKSFPPEYVLKDIGYSIELAKSMNVDPQVTELAEKYYQAAVDNGLGGRYFPAVIELIEKGVTP